MQIQDQIESNKKTQVKVKILNQIPKLSLERRTEKILELLRL